MRRIMLAAILAVGVAAPVFAQQSATEAELKRLAPYHEMLREFPGLTIQQYNDAVRNVARERSRELTTQPLYDLPTVPRYETPSVDPWARTWRVPSTTNTYDWQSGNSYTTRKRLNGDTDVSGYNLNTGKSWQTTIKPNGSMTGWDGDLNSWTYDSRTKTYFNYGTGRMCFGEGYLRTCY
jgi:hypothetical protein